MAENSKIEWTDHTFNPWEGCQKVGPGCDHCYAEARNARFGGGHAVNWGPGAPRRRTSDANWRKPLHWESDAEAFYFAFERRQRVFCASLADVFDNEVPEQWRVDLFNLIARTPSLDWLLLTKRIGNVLPMLRNMGASELPRNVWLGATVVNQEEADRDIPKLLATPARVRFLSIEPMLGPINLEQACDIAEQQVFGSKTWSQMAEPARCVDAMRNGSVVLLDWVICGGESGSGARPMHPAWARGLRNQCKAAGVPFLFKQWGEWRAIDQGAPDWYQPLYRSNRIAKVDEDQRHLDEVFGRRLTVEQLCLRKDGQHVDITSPQAWRHETAPIQAFRVGKKAAGRLLDGVEHNGFPR